MKNFTTKANLSGGDDSGTATKFGAKEFNSIAAENKTAVTSSGQSLTSGTGDDTDTEQLARALTIASQSGMVYTDSGAANAYVLTRVGSFVQPSSYFPGMGVVFKPDNANTGNSTVNISTLGSKKILDNSGAEIAAGVITSNRYISIIYDSTLDSGSGAFVLDPATARAATDTEVDNQSVIDAYVQPGQLGSVAILDAGSGDSEIPTGSQVTDRIESLDYNKTFGLVEPSGTSVETAPTGYRFVYFDPQNTDAKVDTVSDDGTRVTISGTFTSSSVVLIWIRQGI